MTKARRETQRILIFHLYDNLWMKTLVNEYALQREKQGDKVLVLDLTLLGEISPNPFVRCFLKKFGLNNGFDNPLKLKKIQEVFINRIYLINLIQFLTFSLIYVFSNLRHLHISDETKPSLVNSCGTLDLNNRKFLIKILKEEFAVRQVRKCLKKIEDSFDEIDSFYLINGRFTKDRVVRNYIEKYNSNLNFLEFGSTREKFQIYEIAPHSMENLRSLMESLTKNVSTSEMRSAADAYFLEFRKFDVFANKSWTSLMEDNFISILPSTKKKILTFFASSGNEYFGVGDRLSGVFATQEEAFVSLLAVLPQDKWDVYLKLHPNVSRVMNLDRIKWENIDTEFNFTILDDARIDSYALGMASDVVAHFNSSIGPELIYLGHPNVITVGNVFWKELDPHRQLTSPEKIAHYFELNNQNFRVDISPWAYFRKNFGEPFQFYKYVSQTGKWEPK